MLDILLDRTHLIVNQQLRQRNLARVRQFANQRILEFFASFTLFLRSDFTFDVVLELFHIGEWTAFCGKFVVQLRQFCLFDFMQRHRKYDFCTRQIINMIIRREFQVNIKRLTGFMSDHTFFKSRDKLSAAELEFVAFRRAAIKRHAVFFAFKINHRVVAQFCSTINRHLLSKILLHPHDDLVNVLRSHTHFFRLRLELLVIAKFYSWQNLRFSSKFKLATWHIFFHLNLRSLKRLDILRRKCVSHGLR